MYNMYAATLYNIYMYAALPHYILSMFASTLQSLLCFGSALPALLVSGVALFASAAALLQSFEPAVLALLSSHALSFKMKRRLHTCNKLLHCKVTNSSLLGQITMTEIKNMW